MDNITNGIDEHKTHLTFSWMDYSLFSGMFVLSAAIGIYYGCFGSKQSDTKEYLLGGKKMGVFPIGMSLSASNVSGITLLGIPAEIYVFGTQYWACIFSCIVAPIIISYVYLPVFYKLQLNSCYEYLRLRFDQRICKIASFIFIVNIITYIPVVIFVPSLAFNQVTGISLHIISPVICVICLIYTSLGGLKGVVWADTLQFSITIAAMTVVFYIGSASVGGLKSIWERSLEGDRIEFFNINPDPTIRCTFWSVIFGQSIVWLSHVGVHQASVQRFLALPSMNDAKKALVIFGLASLATKSLSCFSGLIMYAKYYDCDPISSGLVKKMDQMLPYYVLDVTSYIPGLSGLFVSGIFSTALSTMSTSLNTVAGTIYEDFIAPRKTFKNITPTAIMKWIVVLAGVSCICMVFIVEKLGGVLQISISFNGLVGGPILGLFTLGMLFPSANAKGAFYGSVVSFAVVTWMCIGQQLYVPHGKKSSYHKPMSIEGCSNDTLSHSPTTTPFPNTIPSEDVPFWLYRVSFYWYALIGLVLTIVVGLIVSYITKDKKDPPTKREYLSPIIYRFLETENMETYSPVELHLVEKNNKNEENRE